MFERFTSRARRVVVLAQEEARGLQHNYIGTEHLLLAMIRQGDGLAARALHRFGMSYEGVHDEVKAQIGIGKKPASGGHIPFTPRSKKVLELGLREAVRMGHRYVGTEHLLLGMIRQGDGVAAEILRAHAGDLMAVQMAVLDLLPAAPPAEAPRWLRRRGTAHPAGEQAEQPGQGNVRLAPDEPEDEPEELHTTPAADHSLAEARRLAGAQPVGSHHLLLAALADPNTAAARAIAALGVDLDQARAALRAADVTGTSDEPPEEAGRRRMLIRVTDDRLTIEAADQALAGLGRAALEALGGQVSQPGTIAGDLPVSASLSNVWRALRDSLEDIRRRATVAGDATGAPGGPGDADRPSEPGGLGSSGGT